MRQRGWRLAVKRLVDISVASGTLALGAPVLGAAALAVRVTMGRPVLFSQARPGRDGRLFTVRKLRTMVPGGGSDGARLTPLGRLLRAASLDELPQLWNVLRGEMSLVGPRPLLVAYLGRYTPEQARRHEVLPGITGWAQINGRNTVGHEEKFRLDVWYVDNWSLTLDARILATTVWRVLSRSGITAEGHATMPEFLGTVETPGTVGTPAGDGQATVPSGRAS
jgi:lipopolysaccharide/colanic/teichoic acid biosynthesis glycosyltransferase